MWKMVTDPIRWALSVSHAKTRSISISSEYRIPRLMGNTPALSAHAEARSNRVSLRRNWISAHNSHWLNAIWRQRRQTCDMVVGAPASSPLHCEKMLQKISLGKDGRTRKGGAPLIVPFFARQEFLDRGWDDWPSGIGWQYWTGIEGIVKEVAGIVGTRRSHSWDGLSLEKQLKTNLISGTTVVPLGKAWARVRGTPYCKIHTTCFQRPEELLRYDMTSELGT